MVNNQHKDRLFKFLFGSPENKKWTLSLYNAINGSDYDNADDLEIVTLDDVIYMGMKDDVAFMLSIIYVNIYEQQSTYNSNMPLRLLLYLARQYEKYVKAKKLNLYGRKRVEIPIFSV